MNFQNQFNPYQRYSNGITWVQGVEGAKAYQLVPNSNVLLMDSESDGRFFIKVSDNIGMCTLRTFKYEEITDLVKSDNINPIDFVQKSEFENAISELKEMISNGKQTVPTIGEWENRPR